MESFVKGFAPAIPVLIFLALVVIAVSVMKGRKRGGATSLPYRSQGTLMSAAELVFFRALEQALGAQFRIFAKVRLWDVIEMERGLDSNARGSAKAKIQSKHVDFVACDPQDMTIRFVVELDDSSHKRADRQERDVFLDNALAAAGVPLVRFAAKRGYEIQEIRERVNQSATK